MKEKLIIFDLDGVLVDSTKVVASYFAELRPAVTEKVFNEWLCGNYHEELRKHELAHGEIPETPEQYQRYFEKKSSTPLFEGISDLLKKLHSSGTILTINTSAELSGCKPVLVKTGVLEFFDFLATAEVSKSKVEKFKILEEKYQTPKSNIIFVTDTLGDLREADIAGIPTVCVTYGAHDRSYFEREKHDNLIAVVDSVKELSQLLKK